MQKNENHQEFPECFQFPDSIRLLWEGTQKALEDWGMDRRDIESLCDIVVRLADHRLMVIQVCGAPRGSEGIAERVRHYRNLADDLLRSAAAPRPEPPWNEVGERLHSAGASPLDFSTVSKE